MVSVDNLSVLAHTSEITQGMILVYAYSKEEEPQYWFVLDKPHYEDYHYLHVKALYLKTLNVSEMIVSKYQVTRGEWKAISP